ncbi:hypothetical protein PQR71_41755 [Paraburkholderia fungorum]
MKPHTDLDDWIEFTRGWLDERMRKQDEVDAAAYERFRERLFGPLD